MSAEETDAERRHAVMCAYLVSGVEMELQINRPGNMIRVTCL